MEMNSLLLADDETTPSQQNSHLRKRYLSGR